MIMNVEVRVPQQGQTTETVVISKWLKKAGDEVKKGEMLFETESDKAVLEVESPIDGRLAAILVEAGDEAAIGEAVAIVEDRD